MMEMENLEVYFWRAAWTMDKAEGLILDLVRSMKLRNILGSLLPCVHLMSGNSQRFPVLF